MQTPASSSREVVQDRPIRGVVVVGKDGYGLTPCGSDSQQIISFSPGAQAVIDRYLDQGGRMEFFLEGQAVTLDGLLQVTTVERIDGDASQCGADVEDAQTS